MEYLKVWTSFRQIISPLTDAEKGRLFDAMLAYAETDQDPENFIGNERFLWLVAKQDIDRTKEKNETLKANGSKGGRPKAKETNENQTEPQKTNTNQIKPTEEKKEVKRFVPPTVDEVTAYCRERGNRVSPQRFMDFYASKGWKVGNQPMKDWKACVRTWEQRDATPKAQTKTVVAQQYEQRDYSNDTETLNDVLKRMEQAI